MSLNRIGLQRLDVMTTASLYHSTGELQNDTTRKLRLCLPFSVRPRSSNRTRQDDLYHPPPDQPPPTEIRRTRPKLIPRIPAYRLPETERDGRVDDRIAEGGDSGEGLGESCRRSDWEGRRGEEMDVEGETAATEGTVRSGQSTRWRCWVAAH